MRVKAFIRAVKNGQSVCCLPWGRSPAAFIWSMQFNRVIEYLPQMRIYKPKRKK